MERKGWYLVAYDIANPKRLQKIHYLIKKEGLAVQKSLFFVQGTEARLNKLLDQIASIMVLREDDLRAYPITHPKEVWTTGPNPLSEFPLVQFDTTKKKTARQNRKKKKQSIWMRLLGL